MSSKRHRVQETLEAHLGCNMPDQLPQFKSAFENLTVDDELSAALTRAVEDDASSTYFKAVVSLLEGAVSVKRGLHSWAVVKLYYSMFYMVRFAFLVRSIGIFRCKQVYTLSTNKGATPVRRNGQGDHKILIKAFTNDYKSREKILSNNIGDIDVFHWLMERREYVNYKDATFQEPNAPDFVASTKDGKLLEWLERYIEDDQFTFCFDADHACLAAPILFCTQLTEEAKRRNLGLLGSTEQQQIVGALLEELGAADRNKIRACVSM